MGLKVTCDVQGCTAEANLPKAEPFAPGIPDGWCTIVRVVEIDRPEIRQRIVGRADAGEQPQIFESTIPAEIFGGRTLRQTVTSVVCDKHTLPALQVTDT